MKACQLTPDMHLTGTLYRWDTDGDLVLDVPVVKHVEVHGNDVNVDWVGGGHARYSVDDEVGEELNPNCPNLPPIPGGAR